MNLFTNGYTFNVFFTAPVLSPANVFIAIQCGMRIIWKSGGGKVCLKEAINYLLRRLRYVKVKLHDYCDERCVRYVRRISSEKNRMKEKKYDD